MKKTKTVLGIVLAVLVVLPAMAAADINVSYFDPQHASAETGNCDLMTIYFNITEGTVFKGAQIELKFDPLHVDIPDGYIVKGCPAPAEGTYCWEAVDLNYVYTDNGYMWLVITGPQVAQQSPVPPFDWEYVTVDNFTGPMQVKMCDCWVVANATGSPGVSPFDFAFEYFPSGEPVCLPTGFYGQDGIELDWTWENGTFTHIGEPEIFTKELVESWNLVSLPLTASDMTVASVFASVSGNYSEVYSYDAETNNFVALTGTNVLENGVGYFISMTSVDTWTYEGDAYTPMNEPLEPGLNMVGWLNCSKPIEDALSSIEGKYRYVARWDAQAEKYKVYVPGAPSAFNDFDTMEPGVGYFVSIKEGATLSEIC
jgi:hypothetical protein